MARRVTGLIMKNNIEPSVSAPLDGRQLVKTKAELYESGSFPKHYNGMIVSTKDDGRPYVLIGDPTVEASWKKMLLAGDSDVTVDLSGYAKTEDLPTKTSDLINDSEYQTAAAVQSAIQTELEGYQPAITIDTALSDTSTNPVENKAVAAAIAAINSEIEGQDYVFSWDSSTKEIIVNEGATDEQRLKLSGIPSSSDIPNVNGFVKATDLATVATSGSYEDLEDKPAIPAAYDDTSLAGRVTAAEEAIATLEQGGYDDTALSGRVSGLETKVGDHTIQSDVPQNAVFTDTVYNDTEVRGLITGLQSSLSGYYTKAETDSLVSTVKGFDLIPVTELPTENIREDAIYLLNDSSIFGNLYSEWVYIDGNWERFGGSSINLTDYYTKSEVDALIAEISAATDAEIQTIITEVFGQSGGGDPNPGQDPEEP